MTSATLQTFFMWCSILNAGLLILSFIAFVCAAKNIYQLHNKWFPMPRERFNVVIYSLLGTFKVLVLVFNVVPYVALLIMG